MTYQSIFQKWGLTLEDNNNTNNIVDESDFIAEHGYVVEEDPSSSDVILKMSKAMWKFKVRYI